MHIRWIQLNKYFVDSRNLLNKLVYVNYNLRLRLEEVSGPPMREKGDFIDQLAHLSFYDENNPVREWMEYGI